MKGIQLIKLCVFLGFVSLGLNVPAAQSECLSKYKEKINQVRAVNTDTGYRKMLKVLVEAQIMGQTPYSDRSPLATLFLRIRKTGQYPQLTINQLAEILLNANAKGILCSREKPIKYSDFKALFPQIYQEAKKNFIPANSFKTPANFLEIHKLVSDIKNANDDVMEYPTFAQLMKNYKGDFFAYHVAPTPAQIKALDNYVDEVKEAIHNRKTAIRNGIIKTPDEFISLMGFGVQHPSELFRESMEILVKGHIPTLLFTPTQRPSLDQLAAFIPQFKDISLVNHLRKLSLENHVVKNTRDLASLFRLDAREITREKKVLLEDLLYQAVFPFMEKELSPTIADLQVLSRFLREKLSEREEKNSLLQILDQKIAQMKKDNEINVISDLTSQIKAQLDQNPKDQGVCDNKHGKIQYHYDLLSHDVAAAVQKHGEGEGKEETLDCPVCMESKPAKDFISCSHCGTASCLDCTKDGLSLQLKEKRFPLACDYCKNEVASAQAILKKLGMEKQMFPLEKGTILAYHKSLFPEAKNCQTPDCINQLTAGKCGKDGHYNCGHCGYDYCFTCGDEHKGKTCEQHKVSKKEDLAFKELMATGKFRPCYHCKAPLEKSEGCNRVECGVCRNNNYWDPNCTELKEWKGYEYHNAQGETWKGVKR